MKIIVDAMGGDNSPDAIVDGVIDAISDLSIDDVKLALVESDGGAKTGQGCCFIQEQHHFLAVGIARPTVEGHIEIRVAVAHVPRL